MAMRALLVVLLLLFAGCISEGDSGEDPDETTETPPTDAGPPAQVTKNLVDCPDMVMAMEAPISELQAELPAGYEAGEFTDFYLGLTPFADFQTEAGLGRGAMVIFIQRCAEDFEEGYTAIYVNDPNIASGRPDTALNFVVLQHGITGPWLQDFINATSWPVENGTTDLDYILSDMSRSGIAAWYNDDGPVATIDGTGLPGHPPVPYDVRVRAWVPVDNGTVVYDHIAGGSVYPAVDFRCTMAEGSVAARIAGQTDCQAGPDRQFQAFIFEGHDPTLEFTFLPA